MIPVILQAKPAVIMAFRPERPSTREKDSSSDRTSTSTSDHSERKESLEGWIVVDKGKDPSPDTEKPNTMDKKEKDKQNIGKKP